MSGYRLRRVRPDEGAIVARHRMRMFEEMGMYAWEAMLPQRDTYIQWVEPRIADESYIGYFFCDEDAVIAGAGLWLMPYSTHPTDGTTIRPVIFNVYTEPGYRRQRLARNLVVALLDWCRSNGIKHVVLHASDAGRPLYESLGFQPSNEMQLHLEA